MPGNITETLFAKSMIKKLVPTVTKEYNPYVPNINVKSFPNANHIAVNFH